jgi:carboxypeptidase Taq
LLSAINSSTEKPDDSLIYSGFDRDRQLEFSREIIQSIGFDFDKGRVDLSAHPFCTSFTQTDVRLTTRVYEDDLRSCMFGLIHEAGHGMYEQGIDPRFARTALASGTSMGIHESQSLFWENVIGRSREFWQSVYPRLQATFPEKLGRVDAEEFYRMVNVMRPSLIRVEADELTYNLHIILRFEIEDDLINRRMEVADIPAVWNTKMVDYLGIEPENEADGCLQDVHWSFGGHGYFPSYTLGKLYAAMFNNTMLEQIPDRDSQVAAGEFGPTLSWLRENIHRWGKAKTPSELLRDVCGSDLSEVPFLDYIETKIVDVYRVG